MADVTQQWPLISGAFYRYSESQVRRASEFMSDNEARAMRFVALAPDRVGYVDCTLDLDGCLARPGEYDLVALPLAAACDVGCGAKCEYDWPYGDEPSEACGRLREEH